jgi:hypothetical protein
VARRAKSGLHDAVVGVHRFLRRAASSAPPLVAFWMLQSEAALAQEVVYSNLATDTRLVFNAAEDFVWDDLALAQGGRLDGITLVANNSRPVPIPGTFVTVEFRALDPSSGAPEDPQNPLGRVVLDFSKATYTAGDTVLSVDGLASLGVDLPGNTWIAIGIDFNDPTFSMGVHSFDPPTVGRSTAAGWVGNFPTPIHCEGIVGHPVACSFGLELRSLAVPIDRVVSLDIVPRDAENVVPLAWRATLRVAVLSTPDFDALEIDPATIRFGDPDRFGRVMPREALQSDVNRDGRPDLLLTFRVGNLVESGAFARNSSRGQLTAMTRRLGRVVGTDSIRFVDPR